MDKQIRGECITNFPMCFLRSACPKQGGDPNHASRFWLDLPDLLLKKSLAELVTAAVQRGGVSYFKPHDCDPRQIKWVACKMGHGDMVLLGPETSVDVFVMVAQFLGKGAMLYMHPQTPFATILMVAEAMGDGARLALHPDLMRHDISRVFAVLHKGAMLVLPQNPPPEQVNSSGKRKRAVASESSAQTTPLELTSFMQLSRAGFTRQQAMQFQSVNMITTVLQITPALIARGFSTGDIFTMATHFGGEPVLSYVLAKHDEWSRAGIRNADIVYLFQMIKKTNTFTQATIFYFILVNLTEFFQKMMSMEELVFLGKSEAGRGLLDMVLKFDMEHMLVASQEQETSSVDSGNSLTSLMNLSIFSSPEDGVSPEWSGLSGSDDEQDGFYDFSDDEDDVWNSP